MTKSPRYPAPPRPRDVNDLLDEAGRRTAGSCSLPTATRRAYLADLAVFDEWCRGEGRTAIPASGETVAAYVLHLSSTPTERTGSPLAPRSIERALAAIRSAHRYVGMDVPDSAAARRILAGYRYEWAAQQVVTIPGQRKHGGS
ncbi:hypothetical protein OHV05_37040 (plasmid) [Kitasatospora sp. NBC_00070]|uniref:hypothetical protein n=1 Tax=Kitasatospora sp. NBC_00070 TaxID=2975962 RepID=UPI002F909B9E